ncbi:hypothetical protein OF83DRAFT_1170175 [Amylostereum chailletii]|nr:hypothetical protein OF83DRAFT_1170175 [Amylostereum chailletii]
MADAVPSPPPVVFHLGPTLGVLYLGIILSAMLYSLTCVQTFLYFQTYSCKDSRIIKLMILFMLAVDSTHQALLIHAGYHYFITKYAQPVALSGAVWSLVSSVFFNAVAGFVVESFFILRLYRFSGGNKWLCGSLFVLAIAHAGTVIAWPIQLLKLPLFSLLEAYKGTAESGFVIAVVIDWTMSISLVYYLWRSRTHFKRTDTMINMLIAYTVSTGSLTSIISFMDLISYAAWPKQFYYAFFNFMLTPLYCNSLLVTLNTRDHVRDAAFGQSTITGVQSIPISSIWRGTRRVVPGDGNTTYTTDVDPTIIRIDIEQSRTTQDGESYAGDTASQSTKPKRLGESFRLRLADEAKVEIPCAFDHVDAMQDPPSAL